MIDEIETLKADLDTLVEIARRNLHNTGAWLALANSAVEISAILDKQKPKPPESKVHEKYPTLGKNYYCSCGVMFVDFERNGTNYCGNCGQRLKEYDE